MKSTLLSLGAVLSVALFCGCASAGAQRTCSAAAPSCPQLGYKNVFERLAKAGAANSRTYLLSSTPVSQYPIHVFRNGLELRAAVDFIIDSQQLELTGRVSLADGDVFEAAYVAATSVTPSVETTTVESRNKARSVLQQYLERSLDGEVASSGVGETRPKRKELQQAGALESYVPVRHGVDDSTSGMPKSEGKQQVAEVQASAKLRGYSDLSSLRMLSRTLNESHSSRSTIIKKSKKGSGDAVSAGLEGMGDQKVSSPYELMLISPADTDPIVGDAHGRGSQTAVRGASGQQRMPASLRMLRQRLQSQ